MATRNKRVALTEELEPPVGQFILSQSTIKPVMTPRGAYYHYSDVCSLIKKYHEYKAASQAKSLD